MIFLYASYSRAYHGRLAYLRCLHSWSLSLWLSWSFVADWHFMAKINTLARPLIDYYTEISYYLSTLISTKESIKLPKNTMKNQKISKYFLWLATAHLFFTLTPIDFKMKLVFKIKVLLYGIHTACSLQTLIFQGSEKGH